MTRGEDRPGRVTTEGGQRREPQAASGPFVK
jgi:hypothetical protein